MEYQIMLPSGALILALILLPVRVPAATAMIHVVAVKTRAVEVVKSAVIRERVAMGMHKVRAGEVKRIAC